MTHDTRSLAERIEAQGGKAERWIDSTGVNYRYTNAAGEVVATGQSGAWSWVREMESRNEECS